MIEAAHMIKVGIQIPNFTYPDTKPDELFERISSVAVAAESAGADTVMVMDHFYQLPLLGPPDNEMFEAYTLLGAIAARTSKVKLGTLVTGVTYRNPAVLAKIVTSLDVISRGRAFLGIGAAWHDAEHQALGVEFPPVKDRFEMLEEALVICRAMFRGERPTIEGKHYAVRDAINSPAPLTVGGPPIMIGGQGERKTLRLMAQYAEMANFTSGRDELPRKIEVLAGHCADVGRDIDTVNKTCLASVVVADTMEAAAQARNGFLAERGLIWDSLDEATQALVGARIVMGDADSVGEQVQSLMALGLDGITANLPANGHDPEAVTRTVEVLRAAVG
ncbi:MAG: LLM class F420-dependent oxidoreductase [Acidimicrobiales bacterium]